MSHARRMPAARKSGFQGQAREFLFRTSRQSFRGPWGKGGVGVMECWGGKRRQLSARLAVAVTRKPNVRQVRESATRLRVPLSNRHQSYLRRCARLQHV